VSVSSIDPLQGEGKIENFRKFAELDGSVVAAGENRVGKSNLVHALRLIRDASLPDSRPAIKPSGLLERARNTGRG
jgi:predicted ATP-dependent endonuclease of OLD family